jgi:hypothetical protein
MKKHTTIIEANALGYAGAFEAKVISNRASLSIFGFDRETTIDLNMSDVFALRHFLNGIVDAAMTGAPMPRPCRSGRA